MIELFSGRYLEALHLTALRVNAGHDVFDGAVFAGRIERLKQDQDRVGVTRV